MRNAVKCVTLAILSAVVLAVSAKEKDAYTRYIEQYSDMAIAQQYEYGIPASITLAQGLLESAAGRSTLATRGNNHFGIKCHKEWEGDTMLRDDDARDECFRVYPSAEESFADHSRFLTRKRYRPLFELEVTDYAGWAHTLRECGYATDPHYANRLIAIIERYSLYLYDTESGRTGEDHTTFIFETLRSLHPIRRNGSLHYVIAVPGDSYGSIAAELGVDKSRLITFNEAEGDVRIKDWEEVYLQEKRDEAECKDNYVVIGEDESLHSVSQRFGVKMSTLLRLNPRGPYTPGTRVRLR